MSKIVSFLTGTAGLSAILLLAIYFNFQRIADKLQEIGVLSKVFPNFWQGFVLIALVVIVSIGILMYFLIYGGENDVVR